MSRDPTGRDYVAIPPKARSTKPTGPTSAKKQKVLSETEQRHAMYRGCTVSDLEIIFAMDRRTIITRITDVEPCGKRGQADIFRIRDVAPYLVKPQGDLAEFAKNARPQDMPPNTLKEYWNGQRARQAFLENEGKLWRIERIVEVLGGVFKMIRGNLLLIPDELALKTSLTDEQREHVQEILDKTLEKMRADLVKAFGGEPQPEDAPGSMEPPSQEDDGDFFDLPEEEEDDGDFFEADTGEPADSEGAEL